jgi:hypothetical protein
MGIDWNTLLLSGMGALIGSALTLLATYLSHHWEVSKQKERDKQLLKGILQAMHDEVVTLWDAYMDGIGHQIEALPDGKPLNMYWPVTQEYFTVYNTNASIIGRIQDHDLRRLIVSTYTNARGLIDSYRLNNDLVQKHERAVLIFQETNNPTHKANAVAYYGSMVEYAGKLKKRHQAIKHQTQQLLRALRKEGVLSKP